MKQAIAKKWVKALRSGKYLQGTFALKRIFEDDSTGAKRTEYCCLGVLCELQNLRRDVGNAILTAGQLKKVGLSEQSQDRLTTRNDQLEWSFKRIATYIEKNWEAL